MGASRISRIVVSSALAMSTLAGTAAVAPGVVSEAHAQTQIQRVYANGATSNLRAVDMQMTFGAWPDARGRLPELSENYINTKYASPVTVRITNPYSEPLRVTNIRIGSTDVKVNLTIPAYGTINHVAKVRFTEFSGPIAEASVERTIKQNNRNVVVRQIAVARTPSYLLGTSIKPVKEVGLIQGEKVPVGRNSSSTNKNRYFAQGSDRVLDYAWRTAPVTSRPTSGEATLSWSEKGALGDYTRKVAYTTAPREAAGVQARSNVKLQYGSRVEHEDFGGYISSMLTGALGKIDYNDQGGVREYDWIVAPDTSRLGKNVAILRFEVRATSYRIAIPYTVVSQADMAGGMSVKRVDVAQYTNLAGKAENYATNAATLKKKGATINWLNNSAPNTHAKGTYTANIEAVYPDGSRTVRAVQLAVR